MRMLYSIIVFVLVLLGICSNTTPQDTRFELSRQGSGRATAYSKTNKIITFGNMTHVAWLDSEQAGFRVKIRSLDRIKNRWTKTVTIGGAIDNHGGPALTIDSKGFLHVVYYPHHGPFRYRKSIRPNDASAWEEETRLGRDLTYPSLMVAKDDTLILTARTKSTGKWGVNLYTKPVGQDWSKPALIIQSLEKNYSQFHESLVWGPDHQTLHLATRMYGENPAWGYEIGYMKSSDQGKTWTKSNGKRIKLPATKLTIDSVYSIDPQYRAKYESGSALAGGFIAVDRKNRPHILFNSLGPEGQLPHQAHIATPDESGAWRLDRLNKKIKACPTTASLSAPGGFTIDELGNWSLLLTMVDHPKTAGDPFGSPAAEIIWAYSTDQGETYRSKVISETNSRIPNWLANLEQQTGFNRVQSPSLIYTSGEKGSGLKDILNNRVIWVQPELKKRNSDK